MKKCHKCGAIMNDDNTTCNDCGSILGKPITEEDIKREQDYSDYIDKVTESTDDFYVSTKDKVKALLSVAGILFLTIALSQSKQSENMSFIGIITFIFCFPMLLFPKLLWSIEKLRLINYYFSEEPEPSDTYLFVNKILKTLFFYIGCGFVLIEIINMLVD